MTKEFFRTCNVLPFSCTHLALWRDKGKVKDPRYMQNKKDSRISLILTRSLLKTWIESVSLINKFIKKGIISLN